MLTQRISRATLIIIRSLDLKFAMSNPREYNAKQGNSDQTAY